MLWIVVALSILSQPYSYAQSHPAAIPPIANYSSEEYHAAAQNWAVTQDSNGVVYVGNNQGLLSFDGVHWNLLPLPNGTAVRALNTDAAGLVWVGGQNFFGVLHTNPITGRQQVKSISEQLPEGSASFGGIPNIHVLSDGRVLFHSFKSMFLYDRKDSTLQSLPATNRYQPAFYIEDHVYVNESDIGLQQLQGNKLTLLPNGGFFADKRVELIFPHPSGKWLISTEEHGLFLGNQQGVWEQYTGLPPAFLEESPIFTGQKLPDGYYVLGTHRNGILILDPAFRPIQHLNQTNGLRNNLIWGMSVDKQGDIWLGLDNGISHLQWTAPFSKFDVEGSVLSTAIYQDQIYVGTTQGIYQSTWMEGLSPFNANAQQFSPLPHTEEQAWQLFPTDAGVVAPHIRGLFQLNGQKAISQWSGYAWRVAPIPNTQDSLIMGTEAKGLWLLVKKEGQWVISHKIKGFDKAAKYLVATENGIWIANPINGLFRLQLSEGYKEVLKVDQFGRKHGLPAKTYNFVFYLPTLGLRIATENGIYQFDDKNKFFYADPSFPPLPKLRKLQMDKNGDIWFLASKTVGKLHAAGGQYYRIEDLRPMRLLKGKDVYSIYPHGEYVFFGTPQGLLQYDMRKGQKYGKGASSHYKALINKFGDVATDSVWLHPSITKLDTIPVLPASQHSVRFSVGASWFQQPDKLLFQYYLEEFDERPATWTKNPECTYTNLPDGRYTFRVTAMNTYGIVSEEASFTFEIETPWYKEWWAWLSYIVTAVILLRLILHLRVKRLENEKRRLEMLVNSQTEEVLTQKEAIEEQNHQLAIQKKSLEELNEEKNHLIGILAHDMRNPLHQIKSSVDILRMKNPDLTAKDGKFLSTIENSVKHLSGMIGKILDLEAIESKRSNVQLEILDLGKVMLTTADNLSDLARKKNIQLHAAVPNESFLAALDQNFSTQVVENLVSNAIKFSPEGKSIYLSIAKEGEYLHAQVRDEGPGISAVDQKKLFGKFQKLSAKPTGGEQSTGLGLSIVKKYVEAMNGEVWCESRIGQGATFHIRFPQALNQPSNSYTQATRIGG